MRRKSPPHGERSISLSASQDVGRGFFHCAVYTIQNLRDALFSEIQQRVEPVTDFGSVFLVVEMVGTVGHI